MVVEEVRAAIAARSESLVSLLVMVMVVVVVLLLLLLVLQGTQIVLELVRVRGVQGMLQIHQTLRTGDVAAEPVLDSVSEAPLDPGRETPAAVEEIQFVETFLSPGGGGGSDWHWELRTVQRVFPRESSEISRRG